MCSALIQYCISIADQKCDSTYTHAKSPCLLSQKMKFSCFALNKVARSVSVVRRMSLSF